MLPFGRVLGALVERTVRRAGCSCQSYDGANKQASNRYRLASKSGRRYGVFLDGSPEGKINVRGFNCDFVWFFQKKKGFLLVFSLGIFLIRGRAIFEVKEISGSCTTARVGATCFFLGQ